MWVEPLLQVQKQHWSRTPKCSRQMWLYAPSQDDLISPQRGQECWLLLPGNLVGGGTQMLAGKPRLSQLKNNPVTCTVVVSGLTDTGSGGAPDEETVALGTGSGAGRVVVMARCGHVICWISPSTFASSLKEESRKPFGIES